MNNSYPPRRIRNIEYKYIFLLGIRIKIYYIVNLEENLLRINLR